MLSFAVWPCVSSFSSRRGAFAKGWLGAGVAALVLTGTLVAEGPAEPPKGEFGKDIQLAPFVVNGSKLTVSIHARTKSDRRYAEKFADEVIEIAYETLHDSTGKGLVIVGAEGEPHPVVVIRQFLALADSGTLDPAVAARAGELTAMLAGWKKMLNLDEDPKEKGFKVTFDMIMPALPLPLDGLASKLYQLSWAEDFDDARIARKLQALTVAGLESDVLAKYDWVFYLPPRNVYKGVQDDVIKRAVAHEKIGLFKRTALKSALFVASPAIKTAVEGMRKGMLFMTVLQAESGYSPDDIKHLTMAYTNVLMPDLKFNGGSEHRRALEAIEKQKIANAEYAKDPFVKPERLATFDPTAYAPFEGEYLVKLPDDIVRFVREGDSFQWNWKSDKPRPFYPAGDRLLVNEDGSMTIQFLVDETGTVTGVEERWVRRRKTIPRKFEVQVSAVASAK